MNRTRKVLVVIADDLGRDLYAAAPMPRLKALESVGRSYLNPWMGPVCSNFRAGFLTGREPQDPSNLVFGNFPSSVPGYALPTAHDTLLPQLAPGTNAYHGKAHVQNAQYYTHPNECGWQSFSGSLGNIGDYYSWEHVVDGWPTQTSSYAGYVVRDGALASVESGTDLVVAAFHLPHNPYHNPPSELHTQQLPLDTSWKQAMAMCEALDNLAGDLIQRAVQLGYVVIFLSDNGTAPALGGKKGTLYELGINCPMFVVGVGVAAGIGPSGALVQSTDHHATIIELLGGAPGGLNSISYAPDIFGSGSWSGRVWARASRSIVVGEIPPEIGWDRAARNKRYKLISRRTTQAVIEDFYDLVADPLEQDNLLLRQDLTPAQRAVYERLKNELPTA